MFKANKKIFYIAIALVVVAALLLLIFKYDRAKLSLSSLGQKREQSAIKKEFQTLEKSYDSVNSAHVRSEMKVGDSIYWEQEADLLFPDKYKGTVSIIEKDQKQTKEFIVINEVAYVRLQGTQEKYEVWDINNYWAVNIPKPTELLESFTEKPVWGKTELNDNKNVLVAKNRITTDFREPGVMHSYLAQIFIDEASKKLLRVTIEDKINEKDTIIKTITFSDYNKQVDIQPPKDEEI